MGLDFLDVLLNWKGDSGAGFMQLPVEDSGQTSNQSNFGIHCLVSHAR